MAIIAELIERELESHEEENQRLKDENLVLAAQVAKLRGLLDSWILEYQDAYYDSDTPHIKEICCGQLYADSLTAKIALYATATEQFVNAAIAVAEQASRRDGNYDAELNLVYLEAKAAYEKGSK